MFERFTEDARRVVVYAQEECRLRDDPHIGTEHLLLGLAHERDDTSQVLREAGFDTESGRLLLEATTPHRPVTPSGHIPFTPRAKRVMEESLRVANRLGQDRIAPPHLLRGLLAVTDAGGVRLLLALRVDVAELAARAEELARATPPDSGPGARAAGAYSGPGGSHFRRAVVQQRDRLRSALARYGRHEEGCDPGAGCTCGLTEELAQDITD